MKSQQERQEQVRSCLRARKEKLKAKKLCQDCGKRAPAPARTLCSKCLDDRKGRATKKLHN